MTWLFIQADFFTHDTQYTLFHYRPIEKPSKKQSQSSKATVAPSVPPCSCGASRVFEMQILPSLLHILKVDQYADASNTTGVEAALTLGGMNFGNIAIYTCSNACGASDEACVLVQQSVDDCQLPPSYARLPAATAPVVIDENTQFDVDEPLENEEEDGEDMTDDDDMDDDCA
jgi:hypothetical protein